MIQMIMTYSIQSLTEKDFYKKMETSKYMKKERTKWIKIKITLKTWMKFMKMLLIISHLLQL